jgi:hypothetical protein
VYNLSGIENVRVGIIELQEGDKKNQVEFIGNPDLSAYLVLKPLRDLAGCGGGRVPDVSLFIDTASPKPIESWGELCRVIQLSTCDIPPPAVLLPSRHPLTLHPRRPSSLPQADPSRSPKVRGVLG